MLSTAPVSAVATFGPALVRVYSKVRVSIVNNGDELVAPGDPAHAWQIRDSNGMVIESLLRKEPWLEIVSRESVDDQMDRLLQVLTARLAECDALLLTGGVSMGDYDYVPEAILRCGGTYRISSSPDSSRKTHSRCDRTARQLIMGLPATLSVSP